MGTATHVVIVGGGIAGLSAAYELNKRGISHTLIEKRPRLGGVIETRTLDGCTVEAGPDSFLAAKPEALSLIKELGMENEVIGSNDHIRTTYIVRRGKLVPLPEGVMMIVPSRAWPVIKSPLLSWGTKLRMGLELFRKPARLPDRSVADFVTDHFGRETLDYLAEPLLSGVYGGDPRQLSVASVLPRFAEMEARSGSLCMAVLKAPRHSGGGALFRTLRSGLGGLVEKLSAFATVRHGEVKTVERQSEGFRVKVDDDWIQASHLILACPAYAAGALIQDMDPPLSSLLARIPYSSSVTLSLTYRNSEFDGKRAGFGFLVPQVERKRLAACTFVGTKFSHRTPDDLVLLRCFFGGIGDESILDQADEALVRIAREELQLFLGLTATPLGSTVARWRRSMAQYTVGHGARWEKIQSRVAAIPGLHLAGNGYTGIGIPDCIRMGRQAAAKI